MLRRLVLRSSAVTAGVPGAASRSLSATCGTLLRSVPGDDLLLPPNPQIQMFIRHFLDIHQIGNKEAMEKERARLSDELNRGYFADIEEFNKHGGKISVANKTIIPSVVAVKFPDLEVNFSNGTSLKLPICRKQSEDSIRMVVPSASLLCISFRASSQAMTESWSRPFVDAFGASGEIQMYEISFIDSWFLSLSLVKRLMLRMMKQSSCQLRQTVYSFGDHYYFRKKLNILNLLTGYVFLLDKFGRIRWQGFGYASQEEVSSLLSCTSLLLDEK